LLAITLKLKKLNHYIGRKIEIYLEDDNNFFLFTKYLNSFLNSSKKEKYYDATFFKHHKFIKLYSFKTFPFRNANMELMKILIVVVLAINIDKYGYKLFS